MELREIREKSQFQMLYEENGLVSTKEKIEFLQTAMSVLFSRYEAGITDEEILSSLQQHALQGWSRGRLV
jgi:hypothetical protein